VHQHIGEWELFLPIIAKKLCVWGSIGSNRTNVITLIIEHHSWTCL